MLDNYQCIHANKNFFDCKTKRQNDYYDMKLVIFTSGVPHNVYVRSRTAFAKPKSVIFKYPSAEKRIFSGFKSR